MEYFLESGTANNPTLEEMTQVAIRRLQKEANGYILLVEGQSMTRLNNRLVLCQKENLDG